MRFTELGGESSDHSGGESSDHSGGESSDHSDELERDSDELERDEEVLEDIPDSLDLVTKEPEQPPDVASEEVKAFVDGTLQAFAQQGLRLAAHAMGVGLAYEAYYWANKSVHAIEALTSDDGIQVDLPVPVGGLDLMVHVSTADSGADEPEPPVTAFIAPGDGSLAEAVDIGPADHHDNGAYESPAEQPAETIPSRDETATHPEPRAADRPLKVYGQAAVVEVDLTVLQNLTDAKRVAVLRDLAEQKLRPQLIRCLETRDPTLVIVYDRVLRRTWWVRIHPTCPVRGPWFPN